MINVKGYTPLGGLNPSFESTDEIYDYILNLPRGVYFYYVTSDTLRLLNIPISIFSNNITGTLSVQKESTHIIMTVQLFGVNGLSNPIYNKSFYSRATANGTWTLSSLVVPSGTRTLTNFQEFFSLLKNSKYSIDITANNATVLGLPSNTFLLDIISSATSSVLIEHGTDSNNICMYVATFDGTTISTWKSVTLTSL